MKLIRKLGGWIYEWAMLILFMVVMIVIWPFTRESEDKKDE